MPEDALPDLTTAKKHTSPKSQSPKVGSSNNNDMSAYFRDGAPTPDLTLQSELDFRKVIFKSSIELLTSHAELKQPFRTEVSQITAHYIVAGGPRELNLSYKDRSSLLNALSQTTHPSVFAPVLKLTTMMLRNHSHPNFVRWSLCNGNKPRVFFLRSFAVWWLIVAVLLAILLILSHESRWLRIVVAPVLWFGITNLVAASKGLCVLLHRLHTREVHPWELESKAPGEDPSKGWRERKKGGKESKEDGKAVTLHLKPPKIAGANNCYTNISTPPLDPKDKNEAKTGFESDVEALSMLSGSTLAGKMSPFGPSNTFDHEPWVSRWRKQAWWRKLHLRKVWVRDEGLRLMQNRIVIQAELWALLITVPTVVGIVACPVVGLY